MALVMEVHALFALQFCDGESLMVSFPSNVPINAPIDTTIYIQKFFSLCVWIRMYAYVCESKFLEGVRAPDTDQR